MSSSRYRESGDERFRSLVQRQVSDLSKGQLYHSIDLPDGTVIPGLIPVEALRGRINSFPITADLTGKRVLDIGAATGWCSFEMERRGAEVMAVDYVEYEGFREIRKMIGSKIEFRMLDLDELSPEELGVFDYVLFFGVFYHLRHPLLGLEKVCALTRECAFVESFVIDSEAAGGDAASPQLEFYETDELGGQIDNWFGPNSAALMAMSRSAGFARCDLEYVNDRRAGLSCWRRWEPAPENPADEAPWINAAINNRVGDSYVRQGKDEYVCLYFKSKQEGLTRESVRVEVDGFGVTTLTLADLGRNGWQANFRLPAGLNPGGHQIRVRTLSSSLSNPCEVEILPRGQISPTVTNAAPDLVPLDDATTAAPAIYEWGNNFDDSQEFHGYPNELLCCFFRSPETELKRNQVLIDVDGQEVQAVYLTKLWDGGWQANAPLPAALAEGSHSVRVRTRRSPYSAPVTIVRQAGESAE